VTVQVQRTRHERWSVFAAAREGFQERREACRLERDDAQAHVGRSHAARSVCTDQVELLAAVHAAALDDLGAIVAWRVPEARPLPVQR
jgi:hypothetical protein